MLRIPDDVALTVAMFTHLPREGTWHIDWHPQRQPLAWQAEGTIGLPRPIKVPAGSVLDVSTAAARACVRAGTCCASPASPPTAGSRGTCTGG